MGLLDDAIREHLELKRRSGADPNELERLEREALGPVRRSPGDAYGAPAAEEPAEDQPYLNELPGEIWSEPEEEPLLAEEGAEVMGVEEIEDWESPEERGPIQDGIPVEPDVPAPPTPAPPSPAEAPPAGSSLSESQYLEQETVEHDVEAEDAEGGDEDDMLEETPEFLQDTPDHDRLWFEQRPPRDFDLDG